MRRPTNLLSAVLPLVALLLACASPAYAQDEDEGMEVNLDALQSLNPVREEKTEEAPADEPLLPPGMEDKAQQGPPELTAPTTPVLDQPAPQTPASPHPTETGAVPKATPPAVAARFKGRIDQLLFDEGAQNLSLAATEQLDTIAKQIAKTDIRLELYGYAGGKKQSISETKRMALSRCIAVRGYLMAKGIDGTRIALRPKGPAEKKEAPDRVDIHFLAP